MKNFLSKDINKKLFIVLIVLFCLVRILLCSNQLVEITPAEAPIDDMLMFRNAVSITQGEWLGEYNFLTISKQMFFAVWLAFLNIFGIPYLLGGQILYVLAAVALTFSFAPIIKKNWLKLFLLLALLYNPVSWAEFTARIYRDNIYPALCMLCFAGIIGICLRFEKSIKKTIGWALLGGFGLASSYLCREDGIWVVPFVGCALIAFLFCVFMQKNSLLQKFSKVLVAVVPFLMLATGITIISALNYHHYGRFIVSDFTSTDFKSAMGAYSRCDTTGAHPKIFVPYDVRMQIYQNVDYTNKLAAELETVDYYNRYGNSENKEFSSGGFYWAFREAAYNNGLATNALQAQEFYQTFADEINKACDQNIIKTDNKKIVSTQMSFNKAYIPLTFAEMGNAFKTLYYFEQTAPYTTKLSLFDKNHESQQQIETFLKTKTSFAAQANTDIPYLTPFQNITAKILNIITFIMRVVIIPTTILALYGLWLAVLNFFKSIKQKCFDTNFISSILFIGIVLSFILRVAMISYIEAASFQIGTYLMYLSSSAPLMLTFAAIGSIFVIQKHFIKDTDNQKP